METSIINTPLAPLTGAKGVGAVKREAPAKSARSVSTAPKYDTFERTAVSAEASVEKKPLPKNYLLGGIGATRRGWEHEATIRQTFEQFYRGQVDAKQVKSTLEDIVEDFRSGYLARGYSEEEIMPTIMKSVYDTARLFNITSAYSASWEKGLPMAAAQFGGDRNVRSFVYYDADYYYKSEDMKTALVEIMQGISEKHGITDVEFPTEYEDGDIRKSMYSSYNTLQNFKSRDFHRIFNMVDENAAPPEGLRFLYVYNGNGTNTLTPTLPAPRDEPEAAFDSTLKVWYGDWSFTGRVPVRKNPYEFATYNNLLDSMLENGAKIPKEIVGFMGNFDAFSHSNSGRYIKSHPRMF